ncbi:MAG TPA: asparagine synthase (glutamine-hydrolyzing) [Terriglobia bacterium]|nr:asparagine synthase (glutamine-hydrolyzing) [Terriglobia bacterium]
MCGISVVLGKSGAVPAGFDRLSKMHGTLKHRGPDGEGFLLIDSALSPHLFLRPPSQAELTTLQPKFMAAVRRLRIHDLRTEADQPFPSPDRLHWIVFNGEIYNYGELREILESKGHRFQTQCDTEVALAAYRQWGPECFEKFIGMWAILIFDLARGCAIGSRDRLGIKPLYYSLEAGQLLFASEPKAVALARDEGPQIEPVRFLEFLRGFPPQSTALSFFKDVHPVPAGSVFEINLRDESPAPPRFRTYWDLADYYSNSTEAPSFDDAREKFLDLLSSSVRYQLAADVRVGCLLSGGLDSSTIARLMVLNNPSANGRPVKTFSIIYDDPKMDEEPYIRKVVEQGGLESHCFKLTPEAVWASVDDVVKAQGQPLLGQDLIAQYIVYRLARDHGSTVVLDGQGADEMLAGLPYYESVVYRDRLARLQLRQLSRDLTSLSKKYQRSRLSVLRDHVLSPLKRSVRRRLNWPKYDWLVPGLNDIDPLKAAAARRVDRGKDESALNRFLYGLVKHTNLPTVLMHQDRSSMAHSIESRVPFLDHRLVEYCFRLPASYKVSSGNRKRVLRDSAKALLPKMVTERLDKKAIVSTPQWMPLRYNYGDRLREMAHSRTLYELPWVRPQPLVRFVENFLQGKHENNLAVWRLYTAWRWLETFSLKYSEKSA